MSTRQLLLSGAVILVALLINVEAQTPRINSINITAEADRVRIAAQGDVSEMRVDVADEAGDVVFQSGQITGQTLDWNMKDAQGEHVAAGTYLVTVTFRNAAGKLRKRVEQVTVEEAEKASATPPAAPMATSVPVKTAGTVTAGRIPKFASVSATVATVTNSVITESAGRIGIGTAAPTALLTVKGASANAVVQVSNSGTTGGGGVALNATATGSGYGVQGSGIIGINGLGGTGGTGVSGSSTGGGTGVFGTSKTGAGVQGTGKVGVRGAADIAGTGAGVVGEAIHNNSKDVAIFGQTSFNAMTGYVGYAGYFSGNVYVLGTLKVDGGCTGCSGPSDRNLKANFSTVNPRLILDRLAIVPIQTWNYKNEPETVRHIGAMAQDFRAAFGFGESDKTLNTVDANGVTMAAIQGLYQMMQEKDRKNEQLTRKVDELQSQLQQLQRTVKQRVKRKR